MSKNRKNKRGQPKPWPHGTKKLVNRPQQQLSRKPEFPLRR